MLRLIPRNIISLFTLSLTLLVLSTANQSVAADKIEKAKSEKTKAEKSKEQKPKEKLNSIHERIESLKKALNTTQEAHADAADALKESEKAISETNRRLFELQQDQKKHSDKLQDLQNQKSHLETTIDGQKNLLSKQLYQQYVHGKESYLQIILQEKDPSSASRQLQYFGYVSKARSQLIASTKSNLNQVAKLNEETAQALQQVVSLKNKQEAERKNLQSQKNARGKVLEKLANQINSQRNEIEKLKRDEKSLSELVERLARAAAEKQTKAKPQEQTNNKPAEEAPSRPAQMLGHNETLPSSSFGGISFSELRGKLNLPVRGEITNRFGATREDTGVTWKGLFIKSAEGNEVKSIANGRVVFADWMRGFGNLMIIDHGDGYMSLYGNNQALLRKMGDTVKGGDTIASVGNSGGNSTAGLYYELRNKSKPFDPMSWSVAR
jgi:septal ring factor EnvC (AmiA/AmiB activator)